jgi:threonine dehydrogenase-like Zn-dependent dehydrogenase
MLASDIFATAWHGLDFAGFEPGDTVAVFGAGPVGQLVAYSAFIRGASKVYIVDHVSDRLNRSAAIGAIPINFLESDPVKQILEYEPNGVTRSIDCIGGEAVNALLQPQKNIVIQNMVAVTAANGGIGQVGIMSVAPNTTGTPLGSTIPASIEFPIATFFDKSLRYQGGAFDVNLVLPELVELIATGRAKPNFIVSSIISIEEAPEYYRRFSDHLENKVVIHFP